jgi:hypothetical protein
MNILYLNIINIIFVSVIKNISIQAYNDQDTGYCQNRYLTNRDFFIRFTKKDDTNIILSFFALCESFKK